MIVWSKQHRIINDVSLSFQKTEKVHTKISSIIQKRDMQFLGSQKYQNQTDANFKFITLWSVFKNNTSKIDTLKLLASYDKDDIKEIMEIKKKMMLFQNTFDEDERFMETKLPNKDTILGFYKSGDISILYVYWFFQQNIDNNLTRMQKRQVRRIDFLLEFFPSIKSYLTPSLMNV